MKECPKCKHVLDDTCDFCPYCGQSLASVTGNTKEVMVPSEETNRTTNSTNSVSQKKEEQRPLSEDEIEKAKFLRKIGIGFGWCIAILPFIITGFSFGFFSYLLIGVVLFFLLVLHITDPKTDVDKTGVNICIIIIAILAVILYIWGPLNPDY